MELSFEHVKQNCYIFVEAVLKNAVMTTPGVGRHSSPTETQGISEGGSFCKRLEPKWQQHKRSSLHLKPNACNTLTMLTQGQHNNRTQSPSAAHCTLPQGQPMRHDLKPRNSHLHQCVWSVVTSTCKHAPLHICLTHDPGHPPLQIYKHGPKAR